MDGNQMILRAKEGDEAAFSCLAQRHWAMVLALSAWYVGSEDSHDAAQEVWLSVFRKLWQLEDPDKFVPWLKRVTFYQCVNFRKARSRRYCEIHLDHGDWQVLAQAVSGSDMLLEDAFQVKEVRRLVSHALDRLPGEYGLILRLYYFRDMGLREISELTRLSVTTIKGRLYQGRQLLKVKLAKFMWERGIIDE